MPARRSRLATGRQPDRAFAVTFAALGFGLLLTDQATWRDLLWMIVRNFIAEAHTVLARQACPEPGGLKDRSQCLVPAGVPALP
jgi:hypothetical protein